MSFTTIQIIVILFLGVLVFSSWKAIALRMRVLNTPSAGTLPRHGDPFKDEPGYRVTQSVPLDSSLVEERFTVSVRARPDLALKARVRVPCSVRKQALAQMPLEMSSRVLSGYFLFKAAPSHRWGRALSEDLAIELSSLGPFYGTAELEARCGRLVLTWKRTSDSPYTDGKELAELAFKRLTHIAEMLGTACTSNSEACEPSAWPAQARRAFAQSAQHSVAPTRQAAL